MPELRVAIDARIRGGMAGGVESVISGLVGALSAVKARDERYFVLTFAGFDDWIMPSISGQLEAVRLPAPGRRLDWLPDRLRSAPRAVSSLIRRSSLVARVGGPPKSDGTIERLGIDVMHFTSQFGFLTDVPSIYHPHDLQHVHLPEFFSERERVRRDVWYRTLCDQAELVAVASTWARNDVIRTYGLPEERVAVVPWAPALDHLPEPDRADLEALKHRLHVPDQFIYYPAQTWRHKNHERLLEALAILREERGLVIPLVSSGYQNEWFAVLHRRTQELGLRDNVHWLGYLEPRDVNALYRLARSVVIPTMFEAASGPMWEAFQAGTPTACSSVTSLPEQAGDAALLFDPTDVRSIADAVERIWLDQQLRSKLAANGRRQVTRFTWRDTALRFRAHYRRIAGLALDADQAAILQASPGI